MIDLNALAKVNRQAKSYYRKPSEKQIELAKELGHKQPEKETVHTLSLWIDKAVAARKEASEKAFNEANEYDFLTLAERRTELKKDSQDWYSGPCPMPACKSINDGFFVNAKDNRGGCRQCNWNGDGHGSGPVGFIAALMTLEAWEARDYILGKALDVDLPKFEKKKRAIREEKPKERQDFGNFQRVAYERLYAGDELARWAFGYYAERGIKQKVLTYYGIGVCRDYNGRSFVCAPFFSDTDLMLCAVRYSNAKISRKGSMFRGSSFGLDCIRGHELAVIVEGENNALSIWQALDELGYEADVISAGNESAMQKPLDMLLTRHLRKAKTLIVWADKETISEKAAKNAAKSRPDLSIISLNSGEIEGQKGKTDANDLLLAGQLGKLLTHALPDDLITLESSTDNAVTPAAQTRENPDVTVCIEVMSAIVSVSVAPPQIERGHEARDELLLLCGIETERIGTQEADVMYRQAEAIFELGTITALFKHYEQMQALTAIQKQISLFSDCT